MASSRGLAILAGLLGGLGQAGTVVEKQREHQRKEREHQADLALRQKLFELTEAQAFVDPQEILSFFPPALRERLAGQLPARIKSSLVPSFGQLAIKEQEREEEARKALEFQKGLIPQAETPEEMPGGPRVQPQMDPQLAQLYRLAPSLQSKERADLLKHILFPPPEEFMVGEAGRGIVSKRTGQVRGTIPTPTTPSFVPPTGTRPVVRRDAVTGGETTTYEYPPQETAAIIYNNAVVALEEAEEKFPPGHPIRIKAQLRVDRLKAMVLAEGAKLTGPGGGPPLAEGGPKVPATGEREKLADLDTTIAGATALLSDLTKPEVRAVLGGFLSNPVGATRRSLAGIIPGAMSPTQRDFFASLGMRLTTFKAELLGKAQSLAELKGLVDALPDKGEIPEGVIPKLEALLSEAQRKRASLARVLEEGGFKVPTPAPTGPPPKTLSPAQQAARARLLQKHNITPP